MVPWVLKKKGEMGEGEAAETIIWVYRACCSLRESVSGGAAKGAHTARLHLHAATCVHLQLEQKNKDTRYVNKVKLSPNVELVLNTETLSIISTEYRVWLGAAHKLSWTFNR